MTLRPGRRYSALFHFLLDCCSFHRNYSSRYLHIVDTVFRTAPFSSLKQDHRQSPSKATTYTPLYYTPQPFITSMSSKTTIISALPHTPRPRHAIRRAKGTIKRPFQALGRWAIRRSPTTLSTVPEEEEGDTSPVVEEKPVVQTPREPAIDPAVFEDSCWILHKGKGAREDGGGMLCEECRRWRDWHEYVHVECLELRAELGYCDAGGLGREGNVLAGKSDQGAVKKALGERDSPAVSVASTEELRERHKELMRRYDDLVTRPARLAKRAANATVEEKRKRDDAERERKNGKTAEIYFGEIVEKDINRLW